MTIRDMRENLKQREERRRRRLTLTVTVNIFTRDDIISI